MLEDDGWVGLQVEAVHGGGAGEFEDDVVSDGVIHATDRYRLAHLEIRGTGSLPQTQPPVLAA